jgi:HAD superfamily hydrolase (TIGR01549 family)
MSNYNNNEKNLIFDFDGTLISKMPINYEKMKKELQNILKCENMNSMYDAINKNSEHELVKKECYILIDKYELDAINHITINNDIMDMYLNSPYKIIVSRNGYIPIKYFFEKNNLPLPDFISCRDNCSILKPNTEQIDIIFSNFNNLNKNNIIIVGDSWHDIELAKNVGCDNLLV